MSKEYQIESCDESPGYRYRLDVRSGITNPRQLVVVQLNPSTADKTKSDPTIGKASYWAREQEFGCITFLNLFARRTTYPRELIGQTYGVLVGPDNDATCAAAFADATTVIFAWGQISSEITEHYLKRLRLLQTLLGQREVYAVGAAVAKVFPRHGRMWNTHNREMRRYEWNSHNA
jgi:hypothetical protein